MRRWYIVVLFKKSSIALSMNVLLKACCKRRSSRGINHIALKTYSLFNKPNAVDAHSKCSSSEAVGFIDCRANHGQTLNIIQSSVWMVRIINMLATDIRGQHIYNPYHPDAALNDVESLTVVGPTIYEADRFATAAFAMGVDGIRFIEQTVGLEGYMVDASGTATFTTGFEEYVHA